MEGFIYLIQSIKSTKQYLGSTNNPNKRIIEHNNKECESTRNYAPWKYIAIIKVGDLTKARKIEYYIKRQKEKLTVKNVIKSLNKYFEMYNTDG